MRIKAAAAVLCAGGAAFGQCDPRWSSVGGGIDGPVASLAVFGGSLYASGEFAHAGGVAAAHLARWDGAGWSGVGPVDESPAYPLAVFGTKLAVGTRVGGNSSALNFWDGAAWSAPVMGPPTSAWLGALHTFQGAQGPELFVSGGFAGQNMDYVARWNGSAWLPAGMGLTSVVQAFASFDEGHGPVLFATGGMSIPGNGTSFFIARWDGQSWTPLGNGLQNVGHALAVFDDGTGPALYVGGDFLRADTFFNFGGIAANHIARWNGVAWSAVGAGVDGRVHALAVFDDGSGPALYAAGAFANAGGQPASRIARWRGGVWSAVGTGLDGEAGVLAVYGSRLMVGGAFGSAGGVAAARIAAWGPVWSPNCDGSTGAPALNVLDFACFLNKFAAGDGYANCDGSTGAPVLNVLDFACFLNRFAAGCS